eukprot:COSAG02_NODE_717_length_18070_cov_20.762700_4_plen_81_part_00
MVSSDHNQPEVGLAIRKASVQRDEIFLTTKIECMGTAEAAYAAIQRDLRCGLPSFASGTNVNRRLACTDVLRAGSADSSD